MNKYPSRTVRLSDQDWQSLKTQAVKFGFRTRTALLEAIAVHGLQGIHKSIIHTRELESASVSDDYREKQKNFWLDGDLPQSLKEGFLHSIESGSDEQKLSPEIAILNGLLRTATERVKTGESNSLWIKLKGLTDKIRLSTSPNEKGIIANEIFKLIDKGAAYSEGVEVCQKLASQLVSAKRAETARVREANEYINQGKLVAYTEELIQAASKLPKEVAKDFAIAARQISLKYLAD